MECKSGLISFYTHPQWAMNHMQSLFLLGHSDLVGNYSNESQIMYYDISLTISIGILV